MTINAKRLKCFLKPAIGLMTICILINGCTRQEAKKEDNGYLSIAEDAIAKGNFSEAITLLEKAVLLNPKEARAYLKLGLIYEKIRLDPQKARKCYLEFLKVETDETLKAEVQKWLNALEGIQSSADKQDAEDSTGLVRLALERSITEHQNEIEKLNEEHQREIDALRKELSSNGKALQKEEPGFPADSTNSGNSGTSESPHDSTTESLMKQVKDLSAELAVARENDSDHIEQLAIAKKAVESEKAKYGELENKIFELEKNYRTALARVNELTGEKVTDDKLPTAEKELADARKKIGDIQEQLIKAKNDMAILASDMESLKKENEKLKEAKAIVKPPKESAKNNPPTGVSASKTKTDVPGVKEISGNMIYYSVQQGDTLSKIAEKFYNDRKKWTQIYNANRNLLKDQNDIKTGDTIKVPIIK